MYKAFIFKLCMIGMVGVLPTMGADFDSPLMSIEEEMPKGILTQSDWESLMSRVRNFEESAMTELVEVIAESRCPGTPEEQVAMLKIAAGLGNKQAQARLAACYRNGNGVRENRNMAQAWEQSR